MKKELTYIALSLVLALGFQACTDEVEYTPANTVAENCPRVTFIADGDVEEVSPTQNSTQLVLMRENTAEEVTVPLNVERNDEGVFQIPESVTFAAGENTTVATISFANLEIAKIYTYSISVDEQYVDPYAAATVASTTRSVQTIQWNLLGRGTLTNNALFTAPVSAPCNIYRASHAHWYKAEEPFAEGYNVIFQVNDEDNSVIVNEQTLLTDPSLGNIYISNADGDGTYDPESSTITMHVDYYCSAGYFNQAPVEEVLFIPAEK